MTSWKAHSDRLIFISSESRFQPTSQPTASLMCAVCRVEFASKNKLFDHLKATGHAVPVPATQSTDGKSKPKKKAKR